MTHQNDETECHPYDDSCGMGGLPCRNHGGTVAEHRDESERHLQDVFELIGLVPVNGEHPDDFELSPADWERLKTCSCAHCGTDDGICPMTVQAMIGDYLSTRDDDLAAALAPRISPVTWASTPPAATTGDDRG